MTVFHTTMPRHVHVLASIILWIIAAFYSYGALVHVLNMLSLTGFDWRSSPLKWQMLDVIYLLLDITVVVGLIMRSMIGVVAFCVAAASQIILYSMFRDWITDVPPAFQRSAADLAYLDSLILFHIASCIAMSVAVYLDCRTGQKGAHVSQT